MAKLIFSTGATLLVMAVAFAAFTIAGSTICFPQKGLSNYVEIRCFKKDDSTDEVIRVISIARERISFRVGLWLSPKCKSKGDEYKNTEYVIDIGNVDFVMENTGQGNCRVAYIYDCKVNGQVDVDCPVALAASRV